MSDATLVTAAGAASAAAAGAASVGLPPKLVLICAVIGAFISVWAAESKEFEFTARWAIGALGRVSAYGAFGFFGSGILLAIAPKYALIAPMADIPAWVLAGALSVSASFTLPVVYSWFKARAAKNADS